MIAGPNGSGKSTIKSELASGLLGTYINPDEIEKRVCEQGFLDFNSYEIKTASSEILEFFAHSNLLRESNLLDRISSLRFANNKLNFHELKINAYFASAIGKF